MFSKKTVLLVGGGGAGAKLASALSEKLDASKYNLLLVSSHPFHIHYPAGLRTLVTAEGNLEDRVFIPYDKLFANGNGKFKHGTVTGIKTEKNSTVGGEVILQSGETISYDVLVLAPGSHWEGLLSFPSDGEKTRVHVDEWRLKFKHAKKVVVAGGGSVGIELAGELRDFYPDTEVTIVHAGSQLLSGSYPAKFRKDVENRMRARDVKLILGDYIDEFPATTTRNGAPIDADLVVSTRGPRPNTEFIAESLGSHAVTDHGFVKIKPTLQLQSYPSIFAMGDVIDFPETKQVGKYGAHASLVAANIQSFLDAAQPTKEYKGGLDAIVITIGRNGGAGYFNILWGLMIGGWLSSMLKSKELFVSKTRKALGFAS